MPVLLPPPPEKMPPAPPGPVVWLAICVVVVAAAAAQAVLSWPRNAPTGTPWFWVRVAAFPVLGCAILYGLRLLYFQRERERLSAECEQWEEDCAEATQFAQEPLALLATAHMCSMGSIDVARAIAGGVRDIESQIPGSSSETVRHTSMSLVDDPLLMDRYASCFRELLARIDDSLQALPATVPFEVHLHCPGNVDADALLAAWQACWTETGHRSVDASELGRDEGVMALDTWLDAHGGPALEKYALFVSAQLYEKPPVNSAEAAVALLLGWAPLAQRNGFQVEAILHRPVEKSGDTLRSALSTALLWGRTQAPELTDVWLSGLAPADERALLDASSEIKLGATQADDLSGFHDVDLAIGNAGVADAWLAISLAAEHARQTGKPQAIVSRQHDLRLAIVRPSPAYGEGHAQKSMRNRQEGDE